MLKNNKLKSRKQLPAFLKLRYKFDINKILHAFKSFQDYQKYTDLEPQHRYRKDFLPTYNVYQFFSQHIKNFKGQRVLDWGCGNGNFLHYLFASSQPENLARYVGCDDNKKQIDILKKKYPEQEFIHYDHYNRQYNHKGHCENSWPLSCKKDIFDKIILFSVATHIDLYELKALISSLRKHLTAKGEILFTVFDSRRIQTWTDIIEYRYEYFSDKHLRIWNKITNSDIFYLSVDKQNHIKTEINLIQSQAKDSQYFLSFYNLDFLVNFLKAELLENTTRHNSKIMDGQVCLRITN